MMVNWCNRLKFHRFQATLLQCLSVFICSDGFFDLNATNNPGETGLSVKSVFTDINTIIDKAVNI